MSAAAHEEPAEPTTGWVAKHHRQYVESGGAVGHEWRPGVPTLLLTTRGRRSGRLRRTPLIYGRDGDAYVIAGSLGGSPRHPYWYLNLRDDPAVTIQVRDRVLPVKARTATGRERERLWRTMAAIFPDYDAYQAKTSREIPVVVLEPREG
ncbi:MAG: nitroreductase family deazaflavin-dependent oxidoreductase [Thermoleophilia bacterium]